ncbi:MAG: right-handed parallel beta-helix repeat-containing protein, partial [Bacteroidales bacterium]|nr:right-handed parallel beta-helix repeat-containing protein [Bacteroidales bacterium]
LDRGFSRASSYLISFYRGEDVLPLADLMENDSYTHYFGQRLAAHLYTTFHPDRMKTLIAERKAAIAAEMPNNIARWNGTTSGYGDAMPSYSYWEGEIEDLESYVEERPAALLNDLQNYGFSSTAILSLSTYPNDAGALEIAGLKIPATTWSGLYLKNLETTLTALNTPGYTFLGWATASTQTIISRGDNWYYFDAGTDLGTAWKASDYDHSSWRQGQAQLGYGDGDESTTIGYGSSNTNKYITTYFRKKFTLTIEEKNGSQMIINLLKDDGAIVYVNGQEVIRANMSSGTVDYQTTSRSRVSGSAESTFTSYTIDNSYFLLGNNSIAVEVHQTAANSSDLSFDLELICSYPNTSSYISNASDYPLTLMENTYLTAVYEATGQCMVPEEIDEDLTLSADCSPYLVTGDITINSGATLTIEAGVELWMPEDGNIYVNGVINALGTADEGIIISLNPDEETSWGIISLNNTDAVSTFSYVKIEKASTGPDKAMDIAAITAFNADLVLDHMSLENNYGCPIMARYSDVTLTNSTLHSDVTGDIINVKYGYGYIENCTFTGNNVEDADAIDYDEVTNGVVRNCTISDFNGYNSDAFDIGEKASNIFIDSVTVYNISDKGVSLGQQTSALIQNSTFINCGKGVGVKDSSKVTINNCLFYGNEEAVACYEKNIGNAGGNAIVNNSILSNSSEGAFYVDAKSTLKSNYCLSDELEDSISSSNSIGNPLFKNPSFNDFNLLSGSPAIDAGWQNNQTINIGALGDASDFEASIMIYQFFINPNNADFPEYISLYNPNDYSVDISSYAITKGVTATIPANTTLAAKEIIYISSDALANNWWQNTAQIVSWEVGKLSNNGEAIQLENSYGR